MAYSGARRFTGGRLVIASRNEGKVAEIKALLRPYGVETVSAAALGLAEPRETGASFRGNAELKARAAAEAAGLPALADDSGLLCPDLGGAPGIHSARWAGRRRDFALACERVKEELERRFGPGRAEGRPADFRASLSLCWSDGHCESFEGRVHGRLTFPPRGGLGFGYDPIFVPEGYELTFGEMEPEKKHAISHRGQAFAKLIGACF